ncbi:unnamed protein product [Lactuca saligna]|uniref:Uncharacterized protein n=1 Tax=Lactuca saligna TaxID=75948 RepID=A0AA35YQN2_LACSI|nr:unnamed protein product [Lactuca saligna]
MANLWRTVMAIHRPMPTTMATIGIQAFDLIHFIREREGIFYEFNQTVNCSLLEDVEHNPKAVEVDKSDISGLTWMKVPWTNQLAVRIKDVEDKTSNDDVGVTVDDPEEIMPEYEGFTIDEKELENAEGGSGIDFDKLELPSSPSVSTHASNSKKISKCAYTIHLDQWQHWALINVLHRDYTNPMLPVASSTIDATDMAI